MLVKLLITICLHRILHEKLDFLADSQGHVSHFVRDQGNIIGFTRLFEGLRV
jgi:hypothetical protein